MQFTTPAAGLHGALTRAAKLARAAGPLTLEADTDTVTLGFGDPTQGGWVQLPATVHRPGRRTVALGAFRHAARASTGRVTVRGTRRTCRVGALELASLPIAAIPTPQSPPLANGSGSGGSVWLEPARLGELARRVLGCVAGARAAGDRPALRAVQLTGDGTVQRWCGSDAYRLAALEQPGPFTGTALVPGALLAATDGTAPVELALGASLAVALQPHAATWAPVPPQQYPAWEHLVASSGAAVTVGEAGLLLAVLTLYRRAHPGSAVQLRAAAGRGGHELTVSGPDGSDPVAIPVVGTATFLRHLDPARLAGLVRAAGTGPLTVQTADRPAAPVQLGTGDGWHGVLVAQPVR